MKLTVHYDDFKASAWYDAGREKTMQSWKQNIGELERLWAMRLDSAQMHKSMQSAQESWLSQLSQCVSQMDLKIWMGRQSFKERCNPFGYFNAHERFGSYIDQHALGFDCARGSLRHSTSRRIVQNCNLNMWLEGYEAQQVHEQLRKTFLYLGACHVQLPFVHSEIVINAASASVLRTLASFVGAGKGQKAKAQQLTLLHEMGHSVQSQMRNAGFLWELLPWDNPMKGYLYQAAVQESANPKMQVESNGSQILGQSVALKDSSETLLHNGHWLRLCSMLWGFLRTYEKDAASLLFAFNWMRESHADVLSVLWYAHLWNKEPKEIRTLLTERIRARSEYASQVARVAFLGIAEHETHGALCVLEQRFNSGAFSDTSSDWTMMDILREAQVCALAALRLKAAQLKNTSMDPVIDRKAKELKAASAFLDLWWANPKGLCDQLWSQECLQWVDSPGLVAKNNTQRKQLQAFDTQSKQDKARLIGSVMGLHQGHAGITSGWFECNRIDQRALARAFR